MFNEVTYTSIQTSWYKHHPWISVCTTSYKVFCVICLNARDEIAYLVLSTSQRLTTFVSGGI